MDSFDSSVRDKEKTCADNFPLEASFTHNSSSEALDQIIEIYSFINKKIQEDQKNRLDTLKETQIYKKKIDV